MKILLKVIRESIMQAIGQLRGNKLRSFLSLLGISIGIFCIIGVLSAVDSLEDNVRTSMAKLGNDVVYVKKWPWRDVSGEWWDYIKRPHPSYEDYELLTERAKLVKLTAYHVVLGFKTVKYKSSSVDRAVLIAASQEFLDMFTVEFYKGRYFSPAEYNYGSNKIILGYTVSQELFGEVEPIGKRVKLMGREYEVIGVIDKAGDDLINPLDFDDCILVSYNSGRKLA
ncbi:MAG: ABC transporter permease, partial [Lewinella sp.]|nr:ABC transporter permease [Lewinella sp.]